jgi:hypothetical protein
MTREEIIGHQKTPWEVGDLSRELIEQLKDSDFVGLESID